MIPLLLLGLAGAIAAGVALSRKQVPAEVSAAMAEMMQKYTDVAPSGERVFKKDVALSIVRTLASQLHRFVAPQDATRVEIYPDPRGAPPSPDLSALGWARAQNASLTIMAPVYMAESSSADRFLTAVPPGQESFDGGKLYAVLAYAGTLNKNLDPPGVKPAPGSVPAATVAQTAMAKAMSEVPADLVDTFNALIRQGTDPAAMNSVASELDAVGAHSAAELLRKRAAGLAAVSGQAPSSASTPPAGTTTPAVPPKQAPAPQNQPPAGMNSVQAAGVAMNAALTARGYKQSDQPIYQVFQSAVGLKPDGYPGTTTMARLTGVLQTVGQTIPANLPVYPWKSVTGTQSDYDGKNAPAWSDWTGSTAPVAQAAPGGGTQTPAQVVPTSYGTPGGASAVQSAAVAMNNALSAHGYKAYDQPLYRAFQSAAGLGADGYPGTSTMGRLQGVLSTMSMAIAPVPIFPWKRAGAYDGKNAPLASDWNAPASAAPSGVAA
jgi:hypothetical protein